MALSSRDTPTTPGGVRSPGFVALAVLVLATLAVYEPVRHFGFVNFDDPGYVAANPHLQRGLDRESVVWAFTTGRTANWTPVTWLSYLLDVELFGVSPAAHHVVNVALHVANVLLVFALLLRLGGRPGLSVVVAGVFALHPLRVESVAWISERKDVLCALLGLCSVHAWLGWARSGGWWRYAASLVLYALGLMAKPMLVTLPFVLLLLDFFPLRRLERGRLVRVVAEKIPFLLLAVASSVITFLVQRAGGAVADAAVLPLAARIRGALAAYGWYVLKTVWPVDLAALYPNPALLGGRPPTGEVVAGVVVLVAGGALALREMRRRPWLLVGLATFVGMLVPVVGLIQVGQQATADRYTYLPSIGLGVVLVGSLAAAAHRLQVPRVVQAVAAASVLFALALATRAQLPYWQDGVALSRRAVAVTTNNYVMQFNLAQALDERGEVSDALPHYVEAVRLRPDLAAFRVNLGAALARAGRPDEAVAQYRAAMQLDPREVAAVNNLAWLLATHPSAEQRDGAEALRLAREVVRLHPDDPDALDLLGAALAEAGRFSGAERAAAAAIDAARDADRNDLVAPLAARRELYAARRPYREDPTATAAPATSPGVDSTPGDAPADAVIADPDGEHHHH